MSVTITAISGIGIYFNTSALKEYRVSPSCSHAERAENKFCPICGKQVSDQKQEVWTEFNTKLQNLIDDKLSDKPGYVAACISYEHHQYFVGWGSEMDAYYDDGLFRKLIDLDVIKKTIKEILIDHDLMSVYDDESFGYHQYMSYS